MRIPKDFYRASLLYVAVIFIFFAALFYPMQSVLFYPEFNRSDSSHVNMPLKKVYSDSLSENTIPLWNTDIGAGYPLYAEGQMGFWFVPNLVMYKLLPFWTAYNMSFVVAFVLGALGIYALLRGRGYAPTISFAGGLAFIFSGYFINHTTHLNLLQATSVMPWILFAHTMFLRKKQWPYFVLGVILVSQQIFAGHQQTVFITGIALTFLIGLDLYKSKDSLLVILRSFVSVLGMMCIGLVLAAVQILPSYELHQLSARSEPYSQKEAYEFSIHPSQIKTLVNPFANGSIDDATFLRNQQDDVTGNLFWESNMYIGASVVIILVLGAILFMPHLVPYLIVLIGLYFLATAKYSPLYFVASIPPFNFFRVPARFMSAISLFAILAMAEVLSQLLNHRFAKGKGTYFGYGFVLLMCIEFYVVWHGFLLFAPVDIFTQAPVTVQAIRDDTLIENYEKRVLNIPTGAWFESFTKDGWSDYQTYESYLNELEPNSNLLWDIPHQSAYVGGLSIRRHDVFNSLMYQPQLYVATQSAQRVRSRALNIASVDYLLGNGEHDVEDEEFQLINTESSGHPSLVMYENSQALPRFRVTDKVKQVHSVEDVLSELAGESYVQGTALLEDEIYADASPERSLIYAVSQIHETDSTLNLQVTSSKNALLVIADTYYPGWEVFINGEQANYYPVNIAQRAIPVTEGKSSISMVYRPESFRNGALVSGGGYAIALGALLLYLWKARQAL